MPRPITRRAALRLSVTAAGAVATTLTFPRVLRAAAAPAYPHGVVRGEPTADKIGAEVLASGGNAVDAVVASALAAAVCSPAMTGIGGYGTAIMIASADGKKVVAIDANSAPPAAGETFRNPELAALLTTLAQRNSVDSFYRGDIAQRIADDFAKNGGIVTAADLAAYRAHEVAPLRFTWRGSEVCTAPLTAGGFTMLQCLTTLRALDWHREPAGLARTHAYLEALRLAWGDRLALLGDPAHAAVPQEKLLSDDYARACADRIRHAVKSGMILPQAATPRPHGGTIHLSAVDRHGNMAAVTLTHGNGFGAGVTVDGLGLTLGHGMSRFETKPGHANSPGPGKRPLHNMCPSIVLREGRPVLAVGGRGGRKIPNATLETLLQFVALNRPLAAAVAAPRPHTEGTPAVELEGAWPATERAALPALGYKIKTAVSATVSAVSFDPRSGESRAAMR